MTTGDVEAGTARRAGRSVPGMILRLALFGAAVALFVFGLYGRFEPGPLTEVEYWWLMIVALALGIAAASLGTAWQRPGLIAAALAAGMGGQLALKDPLWFQRVRVLPSGFSAVIWATILLQAVLALREWLQKGAQRQIPRVLAGLGRVRVGLLVIVMIVAARGVMEPVAQHSLGMLVKQLALSLAFIGLNLVGFVALILALPDAPLARLAGRVEAAVSLPGAAEHLRPLDRWLPWAVAAAVFAVCLAIFVFSFDAVPHLDDLTYRFQSTYLSHGLVSLPVPPSLEAFDLYLMDHHDGKWYATTFPGWPAALAIAQALHVQPVLTPALAAASVLLLHDFTRRVLDRGTANLAVVLLAVSPWYLSLSSTQLVHTFTLVLILGAWCLLLRARSRAAVVGPFVAGAALGWLFLTRPLEGLLVGVLTGLWTLSFLRGERGQWRLQWRTVIAYGLGCLALGALIFPYQAALTGNPLTTPLNEYYDHYWGPGSNALGFGPDKGAVPSWGDLDPWPGHSPLEALINAQQNLAEMDFTLLGWGGAALAFAAIFLIWGRWSPLNRAMAALSVLTVLLYAFYWFYGGFYAGARYWFLCLVPLLLFTAEGIGITAARFAGLFAKGQAGARLGVGVAFLCLFSVLGVESWLAFNRYPGINSYHDGYARLAREARFRDALVFIEDASDREYGSAYWVNDFAPGAHDPLFARYLGPESLRQIAEAWPDRKIWFVRGRNDGGSEVTVERGPLSLDEIE